MPTHDTPTADRTKRRVWATSTAVLVLLAGLALAGRCGRIGPPVVAAGAEKLDAGPAHLTILNQDDCAWRIVVTPTVGGQPRVWKVDVAASLRVAVPAGEYSVEQTMLSVETGAETQRNFTMQVDAGQNYRWRLATLLFGKSAEAQEAAPAKQP